MQEAGHRDTDSSQNRHRLVILGDRFFADVIGAEGQNIVNDPFDLVSAYSLIP